MATHFVFDLMAHIWQSCMAPKAHPLPSAPSQYLRGLSINFKNLSKISVNFATIGKTLLLLLAATQPGNILQHYFVSFSLHFLSKQPSLPAIVS